MRMIKFRAWDIIRNKMLNNNDLWNIPYNELFIDTPDSRAIEMMQYTGMKDINEKEIYEGDIVKIHKRMEGNDFIGEVIYDESEGCYWTMKGDEMDHIKVTFDLESYSHEVIGNIYENAGLLDWNEGF